MPAPRRSRRRRSSKEEDERFAQAQRALDNAIAGGYNQHQGRPGEVMPYRPGSILAFLNPRQDQMDALARWAAADSLTRGSAPSVDPKEPPGKLVDGSTGSDGVLYVDDLSGITEMQQLKGKRFCYADQKSTTGYVFPRAALRKVGIDLVLVIDTSDSMQSVLEDVKREVRAFIGDLQQMVPASRVAVVAYRDKGDEYVTKWVDFSFHTAKVQNFVAGLRADGGGDYPEAVKAAVQAAVRELSWRKTARRILIVIGGSPPHAADVPELLQLVRTFREKNGAVGAIDVTDRLHVEYEHADWVAHGSQGEFKATGTPAFYREVSEAFVDVARQGGGEMLRLGENKALLREVMALTFGTRWRVEMARFMDRLQ